MRATEHEHLVMNCKDYEESRFKPGGASPKVDGVRAYYYPGERDLLWSRQDKPIRGMQHIIYDLEQQNINWPVDMELYVPGLEFNEISGIVRNHQDTPQINAGIIDVVSPGYLADRLKRRPQATENIIRLPYYPVKTHTQFLKFHRKWIDLGFEGSVIKTLDHEYRNNRSYDWMREVPVKSEDCTILDVYEGNGKMSGILGGFMIDFKGLTCKVGTLKDVNYEMRRYIWENPDQYIGLVIEVQYKNLQPTGKPRQPRMKGIRYDKS